MLRGLLLAAVLLALTAPPATAASLAGTQWRLKTMADGTVAHETGRRGCKKDGTVSGRHTCNNSFGGDSAPGARRAALRGTPVDADRLRRPGRSPGHPGALAKTRAYRRTGRRLVLLDGRGRRLARLRRR